MGTGYLFYVVDLYIDLSNDIMPGEISHFR